MSYQLTSGAILDSYNNNSQGKPTLQVLDVKHIGANGGGGERYRLVLSDGTHYQQAMLATQMNHMVTNGKINKFCILMLDEYVCNVVSNRRIIVALQVTMIDPGPGNQIGDPSNVEATGGGSAPQQQQQQHQQQRQQQQSNNNFNNSNNSKPAVPSYMQGGSGGGGGGAPKRNFHPISSLNPYQNRWVIKARVTSKGDIREWHNARGDGKLFSIDLLDAEGGQIRATMFNDACEKFFPVFEQDKVYIIQRGNLKLANKKFSHVPNEYELTLNADAEVEFVGEDDAIEVQKFDFTPIIQIENCAENDYVDIIGIATAISPIAKIISSKTQRELTKRTYTMTDSSLTSVDVTLWGETAEKWNEENVGKVVAIKICRVSDFGGKSLNTSFGSQFFINPDRDDARKLMTWYENQGKGANFESISKKMGGGSGNDPRVTFQAIKDEQLGFKEKPDYFVVKGTVTFYRHDLEKPPWYNACPTPDCNKKVLQNDPGGLWHCEKCNKGYPAPVPRYILSLMCCDMTGSTWLTAFNEVAQVLLGKSAQDLNEYKEAGNSVGFEAVFQEANFKTYMFKCRAKSEIRDDEQRVRCHVMSATPLDFKKESAALMTEIEAYA